MKGHIFRKSSRITLEWNYIISGEGCFPDKMCWPSGMAGHRRLQNCDAEAVLILGFLQQTLSNNPTARSLLPLHLKPTKPLAVFWEVHCIHVARQYFGCEQHHRCTVDCALVCSVIVLFCQGMQNQYSQTVAYSRFCLEKFAVNSAFSWSKDMCMYCNLKAFQVFRLHRKNLTSSI